MMIHPVDVEVQRFRNQEPKKRAKLYVQLSELYIPTCEAAHREWRETARWIKYEENIEFGAERWGKPHVPSLSFHDLLNLREILEEGVVMLDVKETSLNKISEIMIDEMIEHDLVAEKYRKEISDLIMLRHKRVESLSRDRKQTELAVNSLQHFYYRAQQAVDAEGLEDSTQDGLGPHTGVNAATQIAQAVRERTATANSYAEKMAKTNGDACDTKVPTSTFRKKSQHITKECIGCIRLCRNCTKKDPNRVWKNLPEETEAAVIMVGASKLVKKPTVAFLRLEDGTQLRESLEIPADIRFFCLLLGPLDAGYDYHEIGRAIGTLLAHKNFHEDAMKASNKRELLSGINDFLDYSIVVPTGKWDKELFHFDQIRKTITPVVKRKSAALERPNELIEMIRVLKLETQFDSEKVDPLKRTGRWFGGMTQEFSKRLKHYKSDITDGFKLKCIMSVIYVFCVNLIPALTFGAILNKKTDGWFGIKETLISTSIGGILYALFSSNPLLLLGVTGPVLIFEQSLFMLCDYIDVDFLQIRIWAGLWCFICCIITVAFELSFLIHYLTRFSEEIFSAMVSTIFLFESFKFLIKIFKVHPVEMLFDYCTQSNNTEDFIVVDEIFNDTLIHKLKGNSSSNFLHFYGIKHPNTALLSTILLFGTFILAYIFRGFQESRFMASQVRRVIGNLSMSAAVVVMAIVHWFTLKDTTVTSKLWIGDIYKPTSNRPWIVAPWPTSPAIPFIAIAPGFLYYFILFVEIEAGQILLNNVKPGLKKGTGYHWDLVVAGFLSIFCSIFGLPWLCAAIVQSNEHIASLTLRVKKAPGEKPEPVYIVEQRVTAIVLNVLIGLSLFVSGYIHMIPVAVFFGAFLFMGYSNIMKLQMLERTILFFIPVKYHPTTLYCIRVRTHRMHLFTIIQLLGFIMVVMVKKFSITAFSFPFAILLCVLIRQFLLPKMFSSLELSALDGHGDHEHED